MPFVIPAEGGCQCGEIRYRLVGEPVWLAVCHCNECKRQSGGVFGMSLRMQKADVELIKGQPKCWTRPADSGNLVACYFCGTCGNRLWHGPGPRGFLHVKPGTLDDPSQLAPRYEGWTKRKAPWLTIQGLERSFEEQSPTPRPTQDS
jgi:hypothetical protein